MKPLILPLKTPFGFYFYETQKNEIVSVDKELYEYLFNEVINNEHVKNVSDKCRKKIEELKELGFLSSSKVRYIEHPQTKTIETMLNRKLNMITLQLTVADGLFCPKPSG